MNKRNEISFMWNIAYCLFSSSLLRANCFSVSVSLMFFVAVVVFFFFQEGNYPALELKTQQVLRFPSLFAHISAIEWKHLKFNAFTFFIRRTMIEWWRFSFYYLYKNLSKSALISMTLYMNFFLCVTDSFQQSLIFSLQMD